MTPSKSTVTRLAPQRPAVRPPAPAFVTPYPPSWVDLLASWLERRPGPTWMYYVLAAAILVGVELFVQWYEGAYQDGFVPWHLFLFSTPVLYLAIVHYLQHVASTGADRFRPAIPGGDFTDAQYRLITMPARPTLIVSLAAAIISASALLEGPAAMTDYQMATTLVSQMAGAPFLLLQGWTFAALFCFLVHELRTVRRLLANAAAVDLYHPEPLYAFSPLTARTAAVMFFLTSAWTSLGNSPDLMGLLIGPPVMALAAALFVWPLWGAHRHLVSEKQRALSENASRFKAAAADLHRRMDAGSLERMDDLHKAMASLEIELAALKRFPTWPWEPATLRGLAAAVFLPILIWLTQYGLQRLLG